MLGFRALLVETRPERLTGGAWPPAIESLGRLKAQDPRIYQILLDGMDHDDPAIRLECLRALREITHKDLGVDPAAWRRDLEPTIAAMSSASSKPASPPR